MIVLNVAPLLDVVVLELSGFPYPVQGCDIDVMCELWMSDIAPQCWNMSLLWLGNSNDKLKVVGVLDLLLTEPILFASINLTL